jgi:hypothetical protein
LQEVILNIGLQADVVRIAVPVETAFGSDLVLGDCSGFGEEVIAGLEDILHFLLGRRAESEEGFYRPEGGLIERREVMRTRVGDFVFLPHTPYLRIVIEMTVLMIVYISAVESEIEFAGVEGMAEVESDLRLTQCGETPFGFMVGIDIEDGAFAVVEVVAEVEEGIGVTECAADIAVIVLPGFEAGRLREERVEGGGRGDVRREGRVLYGCGFDSGLHDRRFGSDLAGRLYDRLEIALDGDGAVEVIGLSESGCS